MNPERYQQSTSGRLVQGWQDGTTYWAFAPNPLPPPLALDAPLFLALSEADRALGELAGLGRTMPNPNLLIGPFVRREAVLSSKIEGTQTGIADLYAYCDPASARRRLTELYFEVEKYNSLIKNCT